MSISESKIDKQSTNSEQKDTGAGTGSVSSIIKINRYRFCKKCGQLCPPTLLTIAPQPTTSSANSDDDDEKETGKEEGKKKTKKKTTAGGNNDSSNPKYLLIDKCEHSGETDVFDNKKCHSFIP